MAELTEAERMLLGPLADMPESLATFTDRRKALEVAYAQLMSDSQLSPSKKAETIVKILAELRAQEENSREKKAFDAAMGEEEDK